MDPNAVEKSRRTTAEWLGWIEATCRDKDVTPDEPTMTVLRGMLPELLTVAYRRGAEEALWRYAWWKNGQQFIGNGAHTLRGARDVFYMESGPYVE